MSLNTSIKILLVDNYTTTLRIVRTLLDEIGLKNVDEMTDASKAYDKLELKNYDLIIADSNIEPVTGLDFLTRVRKRGDETPFILISSDARAETVVQARKAGVSQFIVKPFSADTLREKIEDALGTHGGANG